MGLSAVVILPPSRVNRPFTITAHDAACSYPRRSLDYMTQRNFGASVGRGENVLSFRPSSAPDEGATALDLVYQAADVFRSMEEHARETEVRAQSLCASALERLRLAER